MENAKNKFNLISNIWFGIKVSFFASKMLFLCKLIVLVLNTIVPLTNIFLWKQVLNNITLGDSNYQIVIISLTIYILLKLLSAFLIQLNNYIGVRYNTEIQFYIESVMMDKTSRMNFSNFDSAQMGDRVRHVRNNFSVLTQTTWLIFDIVYAFINISVSFVLLSRYRWWGGIFTIISLFPFMYYNRKYANKKLSREKEQIRDNRKKDYFRNALFDTKIQFELKLNNFGDYFIDQYNIIWDKLYKINKREDVEHTVINSIIVLVNLFSEFLMLIVSAWDVSNLLIGIGDLQYNLNLVSRLRSQTQLLINNIIRIQTNDLRLSDLRDFICMESELEEGGGLIPTAHPKIEFCDVSFKYPNTNKYALKHCSFAIESNQNIAIVGTNGSGKTTIVKLLLKLYDPCAGCIKIDDIDIKQYNPYELRKTFGVLFQSNVPYSLPLREIIALSKFDRRFDDLKLSDVCSMSGLDVVIKDWENGYDSVMGRYYSNNGKSFSGGQWQLAGWSRSYFCERQYMILDEPSSSLDPLVEDRIFRLVYSDTIPKQSIVISHRLSCASLADKIIVVDSGRIIECGSHRELLDLKGTYAHLYHIQAQRYQ